MGAVDLSLSDSLTAYTHAIRYSYSFYSYGD